MNTMQTVPLRAGLTILLRQSASDESPGQFNWEQNTDTALDLNDAIRIRSAEFWLELGEPDRASKELEALSNHASQHPWGFRVRMQVVSAMSFY